MNEFIAIEDIRPILAAKRILPTITLWNRLEGRPRAHEFGRALKAEVRDALWMLTRQWQMGEFEGDDAGSPIFAKVRIETTQLTKYRAASNPVQAFEDDIPLEAKVEQRAIPFIAGGQALSWDIRVLIGRRWLQLAGGIEPGLRGEFVAAYPVPAPDPDAEADAAVAAHRIAWQQISALAGRAMDGYALYAHLKANPANHAHDGIALANPGSAAAIEALEAGFVAWFERLFLQPMAPANNAWLPERLEYAFECAAPQGATEKHLVADEYFHGHLDWYNLDVAASADGIGDLPEGSGTPPTDVEERHVASFVPVPISFDGMPNTRWWTFEEGRTNFGDIDPDTTDLNKLMLMEFCIVYANDWFLMPFTVPAGTIATVRGLAVTNVFGERIWIEPSGRGSDEAWQRWSMYTLATRGREDVPADLSLVVVPSVPKIQQSPDVEAVHMIRDELANMVWGIETTVALPTGDPLSGRTAARDTARYHRRLVEAKLPPAEPPPPELENDAAIRYQLMTTVPENWIPFVPVHVPGSNREIQLRRAAMPRIVPNDPDPPKKIRPRTDLLRHGLDGVPGPYNLHEEEVARAGAFVTQSFQRTRWYDGRVCVWFGARKATGRGERSSGLRFDQTTPKR